MLMVVEGCSFWGAQLLISHCARHNTLRAAASSPQSAAALLFNGGLWMASSR